MNNLIQVAFYLRSATGNETDLSRQQKVLGKELVRRGFDSSHCQVGIYIDENQSGMMFGSELNQIIEQVKDGTIDVVMVSRLNRISRSAKGLSTFYDLIRRHKFRFISENENIDSSVWPWMCEMANESH